MRHNFDEKVQEKTPHADLEDILPGKLPNAHLLELLSFVPVREGLSVAAAGLRVGVAARLLPMELSEEAVVVLLAFVFVT
jgi:hypothetical protein